MILVNNNVNEDIASDLAAAKTSLDSAGIMTSKVRLEL